MIFVVLLVGFGVVRLRLPFGSDDERYHDRTFTCINVVDGDTIDIGVPDGDSSRTRIRLWGVDTPETAKSPSGLMFFGDEASAFTRSQVQGKPVRVRLAPNRTRGKYGRLLAYVYLDDAETMLNEAIITTGHGYADARFDHPWKQRFGDLERSARKAKVGLWQGVTSDRMPAWRQRYEARRAPKAR